jgi:hypothetical protein
MRKGAGRRRRGVRTHACPDRPITHAPPQDFLNNVCTNVIHMQGKKLKYYNGGRLWASNALHDVRCRLAD